MTIGRQEPHAYELSPRYICPVTRAHLHRNGDVLHSEEGNPTYVIRSGIPQFLRFDAAEDEQSRTKLRELVRVARREGWRLALNMVYGDDRALIEYVTNPERASFIDLVPITKDSEVLEIGPGLGQFTSLLAQRSRCVCAIEVVAEQAEFVMERCRQEHASNVVVAAGGDDCRLPYTDQAFDVVIANLVFEWCASRCPNEKMTAVQRRFLGECFRVLKTGGSLYMSTKNRFALRYLLGQRDEHCHGLRFGSALPRRAAQLMQLLRGHSAPAGKLYSYIALVKMLQDCGFRGLRSFWAVPEMRFPAQYVPTDAASIRDARRNRGFIQGESQSTRLLMRLIPAPLVRYFTPGLTFVAIKVAPYSPD